MSQPQSVPSASAPAPAVRKFESDAARVKKLSDLYGAAIQARETLRIVKDRNKRSLEAAEAAYSKAADDLAQMLTENPGDDPGARAVQS